MSPLVFWREIQNSDEVARNYTFPIMSRQKCRPKLAISCGNHSNLCLRGRLFDAICGGNLPSLPVFSRMISISNQDGRTKRFVVSGSTCRRYHPSRGAILMLPCRDHEDDTRQYPLHARRKMNVSLCLYGSNMFRSSKGTCAKDPAQRFSGVRITPTQHF